MITYYLTLSRVFPSTHNRAGEPTNFENAFKAGQKPYLDKDENTNSDVPQWRASYAVQDAWLCTPPCTYRQNPYCHVDCPYFYECYPDEE